MKVIAAVAAAVLGATGAACAAEQDDASDRATTTTGAGALLADPAECIDYSGTEGITDDEIRIGNSVPQSGPFALFNEVQLGMRAYFDMVNEQGGVEGRRLELVSLDDQYLPERTRANVETLVKDDGAFALAGVLGTENVLATQQYLEEQGLCVPNIPASVGAPQFSDPDLDPWVIAGLPSYEQEARAFADHLRRERPGAKVAVLRQADSFGDGYAEGFAAAIEGTDIEIVAEQTFDPRAELDPTTQVTTLGASGADTFLVAVAGRACPGALQAADTALWQPITYVTLTCSSQALMGLAGEAADGVLSSQVSHDPSNPAVADLPAVAEFLRQGAASGLTEQQLASFNTAAGWQFAAYLVQVLEAAPTLDRATVMNTAWKQTDVRFGMMLDGIDWSTDGAEDPFGYEQLQVVRRVAGQWDAVGDPTDVGA
jgi:branched-chain amino acid transport system substrate-binding protein